MIQITLMERLSEHLGQALNQTVIILNADAQTPTERTVIIKRGRILEARPHEVRRGSLELLVECWEYCEEDFQAGNELLGDLIDSVLAAMESFIQDQITTQNLHLDISTILDPDGDLFRPAVAAQITATINWRFLT